MQSAFSWPCLSLGSRLPLMELFFDTRSLSLSMIPTAVVRTLCNESFGHLWYLFKLIGLYLLLSMLKVFADHADEKQYRGLLAGIFALNFCIPLLNNLLGISIAFEVSVGTYVFYALLGRYLVQYETIWRKKLLVSIAQIAAVVVLAAGASAAHGPLEALFAYTSPVNVCLSAGVFSLFMVKDKPVAAGMWRVDRLCFGVYLIHPVFIHFTYKFLRVRSLNAVLYPVQIILFTVIFTALSFAGAWILSLVKPLKKYIL